MNRVIIIFIICLFHFPSFACSCWGPPTFCEYITESWIESDLIVKGKKIRNIEHGFEFQVTNIYRGEEIKENIIVWGDQGWLCRYYNGKFIDGEEYYLALIRLFEDTENSWAQSNPIGPLEKEDDYTISFCGKSYWHKTDEVNGELEVDVIDCLNELPPTSGVEIITAKDEDLCDVEKTELFPNPASYRAFIRLPDNQELTEGTARIFDDCGKLVYQWDNIEQFYNLGLFTFNVSTLRSGLYFLDVNLPELCEANLTRRLVVR